MIKPGSSVNFMSLETRTAGRVVHWNGRILICRINTSKILAYLPSFGCFAGASTPRGMGRSGHCLRARERARFKPWSSGWCAEHSVALRTRTVGPAGAMCRHTHQKNRRCCAGTAGKLAALVPAQRGASSVSVPVLTESCFPHWQIIKQHPIQRLQSRHL